MHNFSVCSDTPDVQFQSALNKLATQEISLRLDQVEPLILNQLKQMYGDAVYRSWFTHFKFEEMTDHELVISVPTRFIKEWISNNYLDSINKIACSITPAKKVTIKVRQPLTSPDKHIKQLTNKCNMHDFTLDPQLVFENFIVAESNKVAYSMAMAFAKNKQTNNLLYIQNNVGMGKTHLLQSITAHVQANSPNRNVIYLSAEKFMQLYIRAVRDNDILSFKEELRSASLLLIDDLQFICGKSSSEQELIGTISALTESNKQVVIACNSSPYDLNLDTRTKSRLTGGLVVNITQADYSLRLKILQSRATRLDILVPGEILQFVADNITSNIRELEGAFNKLVSYCSITEQPMSFEATKEILQDNIAAHTRQININQILEHVASFYRVKVADIQSKKRNAHFVLPRQIAAYIAKQLTTLSLQEIGLQLGNKDHATVIYSIKKVEEKITYDPVFANVISKIMPSLKN
jgi:chromosomal replication initiator protein